MPRCNPRSCPRAGQGASASRRLQNPPCKREPHRSARSTLCLERIAQSVHSANGCDALLIDGAHVPLLHPSLHWGLEVSDSLPGYGCTNDRHQHVKKTCSLFVPFLISI